MFINTNTDKDLFDFNDYSMHKVHNVISYEHDQINYNGWNIVQSDILEHEILKDLTYYLIIDTKEKNATGHWIYECALYLPIFLDLKKIYPNIKIVLLEKRSYKKLFIEHFGISMSDIVYIDVERPLLKNNICFFPIAEFALNEPNLTPIYIKYIDRFYDMFVQPITRSCNDNIILCLPRQKLENYGPNDRSYDTTDIENFIKEKDIGLVVNTDTIETLEQQMYLIRNSANIVLTDGAPSTFNPMFASSSVIYICDNNTLRQRQIFKKLDYIFQRHMMRNKLVYIHKSNNVFTRNDFI